MHTSNQGRAVLRTLVWVSFTLIGAGIALGGVGLFGLQTVLFGFGFDSLGCRARLERYRTYVNENLIESGVQY